MRAMTDAHQGDNPTALRLRLARTGYVPLPLYGKVPPTYGKNNSRKGLPGWEKLDSVTREQIEIWARTWPDAVNTGVLTKRVPTLDVDILNEEAVRAIEELVREHHEEHGHILPRIGKAPKRAIPFRTDEPFEKIIANVIAPNGLAEKIEFLGDGQQFVVAGIHPDTEQPYRWYGGEPGQIARAGLPYIRKQEAQALVDDIVELLVRNFGYKRAPERPRNRMRLKRNGGGKGFTIEVDGGTDDWQYLIDNILAGRELHDSLRDLGAKLIASGMSAGAAVNQLRAFMNVSTAPRDDRWQERYDDIVRLVESAEDLRNEKARPAAADAPSRSLDEVQTVFRKWLGAEYDVHILNAALAAAASEQLSGDPLWLLVISGSGNAKTETVQALAGAGAQVTSTIASEGALLSATPRREKSKHATGGLLRKIGNRGILVIKDVTSILSADRNVRAGVLAALREIHDGCWERNVGTDGGRTLTWTGRLVVIGAVTTAWDAAHGVIAAMGDRFIIIRSKSTIARANSAIKAISNTGEETAMRAELAQAVGGLIYNASKDGYRLNSEETDRLVKAADIVTYARTGVERDYRGEVIDAHAPEMPTRFAKQLAQLVRGAVAIGMSVDDAMHLAIRCARDSIPPLRREILLDIAANPGSRPREAHRRIGRPRHTVRRELEALYMLRLLQCDETDEEHGRKMRAVQYYRLADDFDYATLLAMTR
jgi:Bifunctional DNA primase/polymerase, N-terminal